MFLKLSNTTINTTNVTNITFLEAQAEVPASNENGVFFVGMPPKNKRVVVKFTDDQSLTFEGDDLDTIQEFLDNQN